MKEFYLGVVLSLTACILGSGCATGGMEMNNTQTLPESDCFGGYPQGIPKDQVVKVDYNINFTYQPENPKDVPKLAAFFTTLLNADAKTAGSGLSFEQAEGSNPDIWLYLTVNHNNTIPDHYALTVRVTGAGSEHVDGAPAVNWFIINHAPFTYTDDGAGKLLEDAAKEVQDHLANGWSCQ